jgi:isopenicillin N synthase-like dioxygenase
MFYRDVGSEIVNAATKTGLHMLGLVSESLGLPNEHLPALANAKPRSDMFYFLYYPATPDNPNAVGSTKHTDGNILTILAIDNQMPGLQIWRGEKWLPVTPVKGAIIINVGDVLQVCTQVLYFKNSESLLRLLNVPSPFYQCPPSTINLCLQMSNQCTIMFIILIIHADNFLSISSKVIEFI